MLPGQSFSQLTVQKEFQTFFFSPWGLALVLLIPQKLFFKSLIHFQFLPLFVSHASRRGLNSRPITAIWVIVWVRLAGEAFSSHNKPPFPFSQQLTVRRWGEGGVLGRTAPVPAYRQFPLCYLQRAAMHTVYMPYIDSIAVVATDKPLCPQ